MAPPPGTWVSTKKPGTGPHFLANALSNRGRLLPSLLFKNRPTPYRTIPSVHAHRPHTDPLLSRASLPSECPQHPSLLTQQASLDAKLDRLTRFRLINTRLISPLLSRLASLPGRPRPLPLSTRALTTILKTHLKLPVSRQLLVRSPTVTPHLSLKNVQYKLYTSRVPLEKHPHPTRPSSWYFKPSFTQDPPNPL